MSNFFRLVNPGIFFAVIAAITYGMNPLFALPLYECGFNVETVLFWRYLPAALVLGAIALWRGNSLRLDTKEFAGCLGCGVLFAFCSLFLFMSYQKMDAGIASTLLFAYPLLVAPIMWIFYREKVSIPIALSIVISCVGVFLLCRTADGGWLSWAGVTLALLSALFYAFYLVCIGHSFLKSMPPAKLTFYVLLFGSLFLLARLRGGIDMQGEICAKSLWNLAGISVVATLISMGCTTLALQKVGATMTAVLGALEPLTAVFFGVVVFHEALTVRIGCGIVLILGAVTWAGFQKREKK